MTKNRTFRNLEKKVTEIRDIFFLTYYDSNQLPNYLVDNSSLNSFDTICAHDRILIAFNMLDPLKQQFINNEFFYQDYSNWWERIYSRATFYRLKREAMEEFVINYEKENYSI